MNNEIVILERPIRQKDGLYCLNDLHKASGGAEKNRPTFWLRSQQIIHKVNGIGTYGSRKVALAYATWISPEFFALVLDTFDAAVSGSLPSVPSANVLRVLQSAPLRPPRDLAEAEQLADEAVLLESRLNHIRRWLAYWREVWLDKYGYLHLPR